MPEQDAGPQLGMNFERHELGTYLPVEDVAKRLKNDMEGQGYDVHDIKITEEGTLYAWRRKGEGLWTVTGSVTLRAEAQGVKVPSTRKMKRRNRTPPKRRGREHRR